MSTTIVEPGAFRTDIVEAWPDKGLGPIDIPRGHAANPQDIVTAALFLATDTRSHETVPVARRHARHLRQALGL